MILTGEMLKCKNINIFKSCMLQTETHLPFLLFQRYSENVVLNIFKRFSTVFYGQFTRQFSKNYASNLMFNLTELTMEKGYFKRSCDRV